MKVADRVVRKKKIKTNEMFKKGSDTKGKLIPRKMSMAGDTKKRKFVTLIEDDHDEVELERKRSEEAIENVTAVIQSIGVDGYGEEVETPARGYERQPLILVDTKERKPPTKKRSKNKKGASKAKQIVDEYTVKPKKLTNPYILFVKQLGNKRPSPLPVFDDAAIKRLNEVCSLLEPG